MITILLLVIAGICNSIMDVLENKFNTSIFSNYKNQNWINPVLSWKNKWKNGDPDKGEKFLFSSTALVCLTDLWHLSKFIMLMCLSLSIIFYQELFGIYDFIIFYCVFTIVYQIFLSFILIKK